MTSAKSENAVALSDEQRTAVVAEISARWSRLEPGTWIDLAGTDADLLDTLHDLRARSERQREHADDEPEL